MLTLTQEWAQHLHQASVLSLLEYPHFGNIEVVTLCAHLLLTGIHGSYLWLGQKYLIDEATIHHVTGLPIQGKES